jgi:hypothetical protein
MIVLPQDPEMRSMARVIGHRDIAATLAKRNGTPLPDYAPLCLAVPHDAMCSPRVRALIGRR